MMKSNIQKFASGGLTTTTKRTYELDSSNNVNAVNLVVIFTGIDPFLLDISTGWVRHDNQQTGSTQAILRCAENANFLCTYNYNDGATIDTITFTVNEIGSPLPTDEILTTYTGQYYFNSSTAAWDEITWAKEPGENFKIKDSLPEFSESNIKELMEYQNGYVFKGATNSSLGSYTNEQWMTVELTPEEISTLDLTMRPWIGVPESSGQGFINGIWLNNKQPTDVYIGTQKIVKIIYNDNIIYSKGEGLVGHTYADLVNYTHIDLTNYTHEELRGPIEICSFTYDSVSYNFEDGMTWGDFINSDYNINNIFTVSTNGRDQVIGNRIVVHPTTNKYQHLTDKIIKDITYINGACCFEKGTQILTSLEGNTKNIEDIKPGDKVVSYNEDTKKFFETEVLSLKNNPNVVDVAEVYLENGDYVRMNAYHPILTIDGYHSITNYENLSTLVVGDEVITNGGISKIKDIKRYQQDVELMYNLCIDNEYHNYIANGIVVHNAQGCTERNDEEVPIEEEEVPVL